MRQPSRYTTMGWLDGFLAGLKKIRVCRRFFQVFKRVKTEFLLQQIARFIRGKKQCKKIMYCRWDIYLIRMDNGSVLIQCFRRDKFKIHDIWFGEIRLQLEWDPKIAIFRSDMTFTINSRVHDYQEALRSLFEYEYIYCSLLNIDLYYRRKWVIRQPPIHQTSAGMLEILYYSLGDKIYIFNRLKPLSTYDRQHVALFTGLLNQISFDFVFEEIRIFGKDFKLPIILIGPVFFGFLVDKIVEVLYSYLVETRRMEQFQTMLTVRLVEDF